MSDKHPIDCMCGECEDDFTARLDARPKVIGNRRLTKLEEFSKAAMQGLLASQTDTIFYSASSAAKNAVGYAKALLAELEKHQ